MISSQFIRKILINASLVLFFAFSARASFAESIAEKSSVVSSSERTSRFTLQLGGFLSSQGSEQDIGINGLIGNHYTVESQSHKNFLLGLGYFFDGVKSDRYQLMFGINAFYLAPTDVQGIIVQEKQFPNLSYRYSITHFPVYLATKSLVKMNGDHYAFTFDLGLGANFIHTGNYEEASLDQVTIPDNNFRGSTRVTFSFTAGAGIRLNRVIGDLPLEVGYRFFYLGQSHLDQTNSDVLNSLQTGNVSAHALVISLLM